LAPPFTLRTLGVPLLLAAGDEPVRFRTRKHFALLIRLAVEPERPLTRDHLIELLWGSAPEHHGRHSLAQAVSVLRAKLGRPHVLVHKSTIALASGVVVADVTRLDAGDGDIRGRFLDGFEVPGARGFEDWRDAWHARLMPRLRDCLVRHMDAARRIGDFATVQQHADVLAELDPLSEDALRGIMEARAWVGDRSNALQAYAAFESRLAEELGARPAPELARIAHLLREGRRSPYRQPAEPPPQAGEKRFEPERVVGREREFSRLYDAWVGARRREPAVIVLTGDPGVGKTTLTNAFASTCQMEGAVVARAQAYDAERELPFAVLAELVRQLTIQRAVGTADPEALSELSRICAEVVAAFPGVPKPVEWSAEITPLRLADAFLKTIVAAAEESPLVLVVDDIHAADNASAAILHVVARKLPPVRLLLILTARTSELRASGASQALTADVSIAALRGVEIDPLAPEAAQRLVAVLCEGREPVPEGVAARILAASGGNPLAIELLVREWQAHGAASLVTDLDRLNTLPAATLGIPRAIRTVFERQVARLDRQTRSVLDLAAVLGRRLSDLALYEAVQLSPGQAAEALSQLCQEGLLREVHGELEFRNELIRAQAYYAVAAVARQHLHRSVAVVLGATSTSADPSSHMEIAWHFLRSGAVEAAIGPALEGVEAALDRGAPHEAGELLGALLQTPLADSARRVVQLRWSRSMVDQSLAQPALDVLHGLMSDGTELSTDHLAEASRLRATAEYLVHRETGSSYVSAARVALDYAERAGNPTFVAPALVEYARSGAESGDEQRVRAAQRRFEHLSQEADQRVRALVQYGLGFCLAFLYEVESAAMHLRQALEHLGTRGNPVLQQRVYTGLGNCLYALADVDGSRRAHESALSIALRLGDDCRASISASNLSAVMLLAGDFEAAIRCGVESIELGERALNQPALQNAYSNLVEAYLLNGDLDLASRSRDRANEWVGRERYWLARMQYLAEEGCHELILGNTARALDLAGEIERLAAGRERAIPAIGSFELLRTIRRRELNGPDAALAYASQVTGKYRGRVTLAFIAASVVEAFITRSASVREADLPSDVRPLLTLVPGRRELYRAIGLLQ
jgi:DNA-binding SARP family transcriptional activator/tetratricopeptide (TPR) repeat protein